MQHPSRPSILFVDLCAATIRRRALPLSHDVDLGGRGLAGSFLPAGPGPAWDAPESAVCFFPGRLAGVDLPGAGHLSVAFLSPRTGGVAHAAIGGCLAGALARADLAGVVVTGRSAGPVGLVIRDREAELVDAGALWGRPTGEIFAALDGHDGVACIGPAAVAGSPLATLAVDRRHTSGRAGLGLALAVKNLLFLTASGHGQIAVADPNGLHTARVAMERLIAASPALSGACGFGRHGTAALLDLTSGRRMLPTDNFRRTFFEETPSVNAPSLEAVFGATGEACPGCPVDCLRRTADGRLLPDIDALSHFTALLGLADPELAVAASALCRSAGLDAAGVAATLACRVEITGEVLSSPRVLEFLAAMAAGEGEGRVLSRGATAYAAAKGRPETAMGVKGLELPAFDPRGAYGLALSLAVLPGGPDPWGAGCLAHEILRKPVATDRFTFEGKARAVFLGENIAAAVGCLGGCPWLTLAVGLEEWALALSAVTGEAVSAGELARLGERTAFRERAINAGRGLAASDDDLPARFFSEPGTGGDGIAVPPLDRQAFLAARTKYYALRGLDADGRPRPEKAASLERA